MGMYTGLRVKVLLKPTVVNEIKQLMEDKNCDEWNKIVTADPFRRIAYDTFAKLERSSFIPFGSLAYMPWDDDDVNWQRSIVETKEGHVWTFQCSLKNYGEEIEKFFKILLPNLINKSYHIEYLYEEWNKPSYYEYVDGAIVEKTKGGDYEEVDEPVNEFGWYNPQVVVEPRKKLF